MRKIPDSRIPKKPKTVFKGYLKNLGQDIRDIFQGYLQNLHQRLRWKMPFRLSESSIKHIKKNSRQGFLKIT